MDPREPRRKGSPPRRPEAFEHLLKNASDFAPFVRFEDLVIQRMNCSRIPEQVDLRQSFEENKTFIEVVRPDSKATIFWAVFRLGHRRSTGEGEERKIFLTIEADYSLAFSKEGGPALTLKRMDSFAKINGLHLVWPFWREFVHATAGRLGYPDLILPLKAPLKNVIPRPPEPAPAPDLAPPAE